MMKCEMEIEIVNVVYSFSGRYWELTCTENGIEFIRKSDQNYLFRKYSFRFKEILNIEIFLERGVTQTIIFTVDGYTKLECNYVKMIVLAKRQFLLYKKKKDKERRNKEIKKMKGEIEQLKETVQMLLYAPGGPMYKLAEADFKENI